MRNTEYIEFDARVDRFLRKEMTPGEQEEFQKFLLENPSLLERAQTIALTIKAMESVQARKEDRLLRAIKEMDEKEFRNIAHLPPLRQAPKVPKLARYAAAAAVVGMLCFGGRYYYKYERTVTLGQTQYMAYVQELYLDIPLFCKSVSNLRVDCACIDPSMDNPMDNSIVASRIPRREEIKPDSNLYQKRDENIEEIEVTDEYVRGSLDNFKEVFDVLYPLFYNVRINQELDQTIKELEALYPQAMKTDSDYNDYVDDIAWNIAIAYLQKGDRENPVGYLEDIVNRNHGFVARSQPAKNLIQQIRQIQ